MGPSAHYLGESGRHGPCLTAAGERGSLPVALPGRRGARLVAVPGRAAATENRHLGRRMPTFRGTEPVISAEFGGRPNAVMQGRRGRRPRPAVPRPPCRLRVARRESGATLGRFCPAVGGGAALPRC